MRMNIYRISQTMLNGYDTYQSAIVVAPTAAIAQRMYPGRQDGVDRPSRDPYCWPTNPLDVDVDLLGFAAPGLQQGVLAAEFRAG